MHEYIAGNLQLGLNFPLFAWKIIANIKKFFNVYEGLKNIIWKGKSNGCLEQEFNQLSWRYNSPSSRYYVSQISNLLQEWLHHNTQDKNVYDTYKCENFVSQLRISGTLQQQKNTEKNPFKLHICQGMENICFSQGNTLKILIKPQWNLYCCSLLSSFHSP